MMQRIEPTVRYVKRPLVLNLLYDLMRVTLTGRECAILLARCGFDEEKPLTFSALAERFALEDSAHASLCCRQAIARVRRAIPASPIAEYLCGFPSAWGE